LIATKITRELRNELPARDTTEAGHLMLKLGVVATSRKEHENRLPLHPEHFLSLPEPLRRRVRFETGYGSIIGGGDEALARASGGLATRAEILAESDLILLPKPAPEDLAEMRPGATLWGWAHCVQQPEIVDRAIERRLTLLAWEAMFRWHADGRRGRHTFYRNNEMAGYCGVIQALNLAAIDGFYGKPKSALIFSLGAVSQGALRALQGRGFKEILVLTQRPSATLGHRLPGVRYGSLRRRGSALDALLEDAPTRPLLELLAESDVIVNGILQNPEAPLLYLQSGEESRLRPGTLICDISCDLGMGFPFARPTSFSEPTFRVGELLYYAVDHTPSLLWRAASWEISAALLPFVETVSAGPEAWEGNETLRRAVEIRDGVIRNPPILQVQQRSPDYPHARLD
jgi:alanine dehydrogenase